MAILHSLIEQFSTGGLLADCGVTLYRIFAGLAVLVVLAAVGIVLGRGQDWLDARLARARHG